MVSADASQTHPRPHMGHLCPPSPPITEKNQDRAGCEFANVGACCLQLCKCLLCFHSTGLPLAGRVTVMESNSSATMKASAVTSHHEVASISWISVAKASLHCNIYCVETERLGMFKTKITLLGISKHTKTFIQTAFVTSKLSALTSVVFTGCSYVWHVTLQLAVIHTSRPRA